MGPTASLALSAALVAGGRSRRMGRDKCLIAWRGEPLWRHQLDTLAALEPEGLAVSAPERPAWLPEGVGWVPDARGGAGPLGGLASVFAWAGGAHTAVLAVDMPALGAGDLRGLLARCGPGRGCVPRGENGFEPLAAVYPPGLAEKAMAWLDAGRNDLQGWIGELAASGRMDVAPVGPGEAGIFLNLNSPDDLQDLAP